MQSNKVPTQQLSDPSAFRAFTFPAMYLKGTEIWEMAQGKGHDNRKACFLPGPRAAHT